MRYVSLILLIFITIAVQAAPNQTGTRMTHIAKGTFTVKATPLDFDGTADGAALGRMKFDKVFAGDLQATSQVQMLSAISSNVKGSAAYVAIEWITGTLHGKAGSFVLHHTGVMDKGAQNLSVRVVPDSGTGDLVGLSGGYSIDIKDGVHFYNFEYTLPK
jgi:Protein of unknown function (DUF3224)